MRAACAALGAARPAALRQPRRGVFAPVCPPSPLLGLRSRGAPSRACARAPPGVTHTPVVWWGFPGRRGGLRVLGGAAWVGVVRPRETTPRPACRRGAELKGGCIPPIPCRPRRPAMLDFAACAPLVCTRACIQNHAFCIIAPEIRPRKEFDGIVPRFVPNVKRTEKISGLHR